MFDDFSKRPLELDQSKSCHNGANLPSVNLKETDKKIEIEMAAPGLKNKTSKWKSRITCFLFLRKKSRKKAVK
jgi:HSP20 family protein